MKNTSLLSKTLEDAGYKLIVKPTLNIVAFQSENTQLLAKKLCRQGWFVSYVPRYDCIRVVLMPHTKTQHAKEFIEVLRKTEKL